MRARLTVVVKDRAGNVKRGAAVYVHERETDGTQGLPATTYLHEGVGSGAEGSNPTVNDTLIATAKDWTVTGS